MLNFRYSENAQIKKLLVEVEALRMIFDEVTTSPALEDNLRRESLLKSSLYSARIEGNPLTLERTQLAVRRLSPLKNIHKLEIDNLLQAYNFLSFEKITKSLSLELISRLHRIVMSNLSPRAGKLRNEAWAVFDASGGVIYLAPPPFKVSGQLSDLVQIGQDLEYPIPVTAAILQFLFEKIHPFADGNGRVGRLISAYFLKVNGYGFRSLVSLEEYIDQHRIEYYDALLPSKDTTLFVEFFLQALVTQARSVWKRLQSGGRLAEDLLLPRRREVLEIIRDHPYCSFDFIARRFLSINPKTLHYDLSQLLKKELVLKIGVSRGVVYKVKGI